MVFADENCALRDYSGIEVPQGTFVPVIANQEISTLYYDIGTKVEFTATSDLYLRETNIIPKDTVFFGYVSEIHEPVIGTNASMKIKIAKYRLPDGFEQQINGYIHTPNGNLIGGELTQPTKYIEKASYRKGFKPMVGGIAGPVRRMGEHAIIASGADLLIILVAPLFVTHTVTN